ncbi:unnamed protein product [Sphagnum tenellum]
MAAHQRKRKKDPSLQRSRWSAAASSLRQRFRPRFTPLKPFYHMPPVILYGILLPKQGGLHSSPVESAVMV